MKYIKIENIFRYLFVDNNFEKEFYSFILLLRDLEDYNATFWENDLDESTAEYLEKKNIITKNVNGSYSLKNEKLRKNFLKILLELKKNAK